MKQPDVMPLRPEHIDPGARLWADRVEMLKDLPKGQPVAELGTFEGLFAEHILEACHPSELHLFDVDFGPLMHKRTWLAREATLHLGRSAEQLVDMPDDYFGWIYVDGDHSFDGVKADVDVAKHKTSLLAFNDYTPWSILTDSRYGVMENVNRLVVAEGWKVMGFAFQAWGYHDIVLGR